MVALAGAGPWPQITSVLPLRMSWRMTGTSPPGPLRCGSTTCSVKAVATAASKALPPFSRVAMPTAVAIQCVEVTTPNVPSISGRVVNGFGLMFFINCLRRWERTIKHRLPSQPTRQNRISDKLAARIPNGAHLHENRCPLFPCDDCKLPYESKLLPTKVTFPLASGAVEIDGGHP